MATFYNQATLSYSGGLRNSNITTGQIVEVLTMIKRAVSTGYAPGQRLVYLISLVNSGETEIANLTLTDDLGGYELEDNTLYPLSYVDGSIQMLVNGAEATAPTVTAGPPMTITGFTIPAGANVTMLYEVEVTEYAPVTAGSCITNTVTASGPSTAEAAASVCLDQAPELTITKSLSPETVSSSSEITYTFVIQNSSTQEAAAADQIMVTDTFDPILSGITVMLDDTALTTPADYTYDEATGQFATVAGQITVPGAAASQNTDGTWNTTPGIATLTVTGTI